MSDLNVSRDPQDRPSGSRDGTAISATAALAPESTVAVSCADIKLAWLGMANVNASEPMWQAAERLFDAAALADGATASTVPETGAEHLAAVEGALAETTAEAVRLDRENAELIAQRAALVEAGRALLASIDHADPEQRYCSTVAYMDLSAAIQAGGAE